MAGTSVMKFRSCILFACMAVVPLVAMFSHKVPREWRLAVQRLARGAPAAGPPKQQPESEPVPPVAPPVAAASLRPPSRQPELPLQSVAMQPAAAQPDALVPVASSAEPAQETAAANVSLVVPHEPVAATDAARSRMVLEDQLRALGAVSIECVPMMQGAAYRCSCRVPADPSGQLQRVFQSSNPDPVVALRNLHGQVQFWKHRLATRPDVDNPLRTSRDTGQPGLR